MHIEAEGLRKPLTSVGAVTRHVHSIPFMAIALHPTPQTMVKVGLMSCQQENEA